MNQRYMRTVAIGIAFSSILLTSSCGMRYEIAKPPQMQSEKKIVNAKQFPNIPKSEPLIKLDTDAVLPQSLKNKKYQQIYNP